MSSPKRESVAVLEECIELQKRKSQDYQNPNSNIVQSMHYRRGVSTIHDMISQKLLRAQSLLEAYENGEGSTPNFESLEDTYKDLINYASFAVSYIRGKMEGQDPTRDMLNRRQVITAVAAAPSETTYIIKPAGGGTGTGRVVSKEEFEEHSLGVVDSSGGSSSGQVEGDGFITVFPALLNAAEPAKIPLSENNDGDTTETRIKGAYFKKVLPKGEVRVPRGEQVCTDSVAITYHDKMKRKKSSIDDESGFDECAKKKSER
jgi:hypothetical protein